jgi:hypothetical protein
MARRVVLPAPIERSIRSLMAAHAEGGTVAQEVEIELEELAAAFARDGGGANVY